MRTVAHDPLNGPLLRQREPEQDIRIQVLSERKFPIVDERVVGFTGVDVGQGVGVVRSRVHPLQCWSDRLLQLLEALLLRTTGGSGELRRFELRRAGGPTFAPPINDKLCNLPVRIGSLSHPPPLPSSGHLRGCDVSTPRSQLLLHRPFGRNGIHHQVYPQLRRKSLGELVLQPFGALRAEIEASGNVQGNDPELVARPNAVERGGPRRAGGQQCGHDESTCGCPPCSQCEPHHLVQYVRLEYHPRKMGPLTGPTKREWRGTEVVITAPTRNRMVG